jgi:hypothetical protein
MTKPVADGSVAGIVDRSQRPAIIIRWSGIQPRASGASSVNPAAKASGASSRIVITKHWSLWVLSQ